VPPDTRFNSFHAELPAKRALLSVVVIALPRAFFQDKITQVPGKNAKKNQHAKNSPQLRISSQIAKKKKTNYLLTL